MNNSPAKVVANSPAKGGDKGADACVAKFKYPEGCYGGEAVFVPMSSGQDAGMPGVGFREDDAWGWFQGVVRGAGGYSLGPVVRPRQDA